MFQKTIPGWRMLPRVLTALCAGLMLLPLAQADETEVFRADNENSNTRPKVLIIFDNSGSMDTVAQRKPAYDRNQTYPTVPGIVAGRLYWATGNSGGPPAANTNNWFPESINRCFSSYSSLTANGLYSSTRFGMYTSGSTDWSALGNTNRTLIHVDCQADISASDNRNGSGQANGYPRNGATNGYGNRTTSIDDNWTIARLYTANYMNWWYSTTLVDRTRMEVAQGVITEIVNSNPDIDFGLATYNYNTSTSTDGGRIIRIAAFHIDGQRHGDDPRDAGDRVQQGFHVERVAIGIALRPRQAGAGGGYGGRAQVFDQAGRAGVPGVGQAEQALRVQVAETGGG